MLLEVIYALVEHLLEIIHIALFFIKGGLLNRKDHVNEEIKVISAFHVVLRLVK